MIPTVPSRVSQPFADPGEYASRKDAHGAAGHHTGIDFGSFLGRGKGHRGAVPINQRLVRAVLPGEVVIHEANSWAGNWIGVYNHDRDLLVTYWHLAERFWVSDWVQVFQPLGRVGTTGNSTAPHLHVQVNRGRDFDYHGHLNPQKAFEVYTRKEARAIFKATPRHPAA